jgi:hypothetical protein
VPVRFKKKSTSFFLQKEIKDEANGMVYLAPQTGISAPLREK